MSCHYLFNSVWSLTICCQGQLFVQICHSSSVNYNSRQGDLDSVCDNVKAKMKRPPQYPDDHMRWFWVTAPNIFALRHLCLFSLYDISEWNVQNGFAVQNGPKQIFTSFYHHPMHTCIMKVNDSVDAVTKLSPRSKNALPGTKYSTNCWQLFYS